MRTSQGVVCDIYYNVIIFKVLEGGYWEEQSSTFKILEIPMVEDTKCYRRREEEYTENDHIFKLFEGFKGDYDEKTVME